MSWVEILRWGDCISQHGHFNSAMANSFQDLAVKKSPIQYRNPNSYEVWNAETIRAVEEDVCRGESPGRSVEMTYCTRYTEHLCAMYAVHS